MPDPRPSAIDRITGAPPAFMIVHISDLHFGSELYPPTWLASLPGLRGAFPHDVGACRELQTEVTHQINRRRPRKVLLAASGDLTALGKPSEWALALTFLWSRLKESRSRGLGFGAYPVAVVVVPGNHDHSDGKLQSHLAQRANLSIYDRYLGSQSEWLETYSDEDLHLDILGIDSCGSSQIQLRAQGRIDGGAVARLEAKLNPPYRGTVPSPDNERRLRILVCHHSIDPKSSAFHADSSKAVREFCARSGIHFVLTGHTHERHLPPPETPHAMGMELRCGTTLQGAPPNEVPDPPYGNTFLIHSVWKSPEGVIWRSELFQRIYGKSEQGRIVAGPFHRATSHTFQTVLFT